MIQRRSFLVGLGTLFAAPAVCSASSLMKIRGEVMLPAMAIPAWCPPGWVPADGRTVDRFQFPELHAWFKRCRSNDAHLSGQFRLPYQASVDLAKYRYYRRNHPEMALGETIEVPLVAVKPMVRSNGTVAPPGMTVSHVVNAQAVVAEYQNPTGLEYLSREVNGVRHDEYV